MKQSPANASLFILGEGLVANTLATVLNGIVVSRQSDDAGWNWPRKRSAKVFSLVLVAPKGASASQIVRWHGEGRHCPWIYDARLVIVCLDEPLSRELRDRDVFGRSVNSGASFADWRKYIAVCAMSDGLAGILNSLASVSSLLFDTWSSQERMTSILPELMRALESENTGEFNGLITKLRLQDWDAFCPHEYATPIKRWLASVTEGVAPSWEEGRNLFRPFAQPRK